MAGSFAKWGQPVNGKDVGAGDVLMANDRSHVGMAEGSARMGPNGLEVKMIAGNERDRRFAPGPGRSQAGMVGERWVPLSEFTARRAREVTRPSSPSSAYDFKGTMLDPDAPGAHQRGGGPLPWDAASHGWDALNASLPVGPAGNTDASKSVTVGGTTNNITVNSPDAHSAAAMVGMHLDRTANDISRNLQGAMQ
jgi:hypothetical protein